MDKKYEIENILATKVLIFTLEGKISQLKPEIIDADCNIIKYAMDVLFDKGDFDTMEKLVEYVANNQEIYCYSPRYTNEHNIINRLQRLYLVIPNIVKYGALDILKKILADKHLNAKEKMSICKKINEDARSYSLFYRNLTSFNKQFDEVYRLVEPLSYLTSVE